MLFSQSLVAVVALATNLIEAHPQTAPKAVTGRWRAAKAGDLRSPCPALNAAANLGVLPRNGKNITAENLAKAVEDLYNVDPPFAKLLATQGVTGVAAQGLNTISLLDLAKHDVIEHDASLTRADIKEGDNNSVQRKLVDAFLADGEGDYITVKSIAKTRSRREAESKAAGSPALGAKGIQLAYGESALLLQTLGHLGGKSGVHAPKSAVRDWVELEKLPQGWSRPPKVISAVSVQTMAGEILALAKAATLVPAIVGGKSPNSS